MERIFSGHWTMDVYREDDQYKVDMSKLFTQHKRNDGRGYSYDSAEFVYGKTKWKFPGKSFTKGRGADLEYYLDNSHDENPVTLTLRKPELVAEFIRQIPQIEREEPKFKPELHLKIRDSAFLPKQNELTFADNAGQEEATANLAKFLGECGINRNTAHLITAHAEMPVGDYADKITEENRVNKERVQAVLDIQKTKMPSRHR